MILFHPANSEKRPYPVEYDGVTCKKAGYEYGEQMIWRGNYKDDRDLHADYGVNCCCP